MPRLFARATVGDRSAREERWEAIAGSESGGQGFPHAVRRTLRPGGVEVSLVERMVCRWGMSEKLGPISLRRGEEHVFLGRELGEQKHFSEHTSMLVDDEIRQTIESAYARAMELLEAERDRLELLTKELLEKEALTDDELYALLDFPKPEALGGSDEQGVA